MKALRAVAILLTAMLCLATAGSVKAARPAAQTPGVSTIAGSPLSIEVHANASIQVYHQSFSHGATYGTADSGFFLNVGGVVYGPNLPLTNDSSASVPTAEMSLVAHNAPSGGGSSADPFRVVTQHELTTEGADLRVTQTASYINGNNYFQLDWEIANQGDGEVCFQAYHAADIYFANSDYGYGYYNSGTGAVGGFNEARDWFMVFAPITAADRYQEGPYGEIWEVVGNGRNFDNTIVDENIDNGIGLQWDRCVGAGDSLTLSDLWSFGASEVEVIAPSAAGSGPIDVWAKDSPEDDGSLPSSALNGAWWTSPDIIVRNKRDEGREHQNPIEGQTNYVYVQVRNQGAGDARQVRATLYWADPALGLFWPHNWNELNTTLVDVPAGEAVWSSAIPWEPPGSGHFCLLLRLEAAGDPITDESALPVPNDNNIAQRNVHIIDLAQPDGAVRIGPGVSGSARIDAMAVGPPRDDDQLTPVDVVVQYPGLPAGVTMYAELPDDLYQRWMENGGNLTGATLQAGRIYLDGDVETVIQGIPLASLEEAPITFEVAGPTVDPFVFGVLERADGQDLGGTVYVYEGLVEEVGFAGFNVAMADINIIFLSCCLCVILLGLFSSLFLLLTRGRR